MRIWIWEQQGGSSVAGWTCVDVFASTWNPEAKAEAKAATKRKAAKPRKRGKSKK